MPKPEHIEALASEMCGDHEAARLILDALTRDPAVQAAVLAALVEGGRLAEESANAPEWDECQGQSCHMGGLVLPDGDPWPTHSHGPARWVRKVRLVEPEWREATP